MPPETLADVLGQQQVALAPVGGGSITGMPGSPETTPTRLIPGAGAGSNVILHAHDVPEPPKITGKTLSSLEDLANAYPGLSDSGSGWVLKVNRISPKSLNGVQVGGDQGNYPRFHDGRDLLNVQQFGEQFGGGKYEVTVYGPAEHDPSVLRRHHSIDIVIPSATGVSPVGVNPNVTSPFAGQAAVERAKSEGRVMESLVGPLLQSALNKDHAPAQNNDGVANIATAAMNQSAEMARLQAQQAQQALEAERQRAERLERTVLEMQAKMAEQNHQSPVDRMAEVMFNGRYSQQEASRIQQDYEGRMDRLRRDFEERIERMRSDHATEIERVRSYQGQMFAAERDRLSNEVQMLRSEISRERERSDVTFTERLRMEQQRFEQQSNSIQADHARAISAAREDARRNEDALRRDAERDLKMLENSHKVALDAMDRELARARADCAEAKMHLKAAEERIAREVNKPFPVQLAEMTKFSELMGYVPKDSVGGQEGPGWQDRLIKLGETTIRSLAPAIGPLAAGFMQQRMGGGTPGQHPQGGGMAPPGLPPGPQQAPQQAGGGGQQHAPQPQRQRRGIQVPVGEISDNSDGIHIGDPPLSGSLAQNVRPDPTPGPHPAPPPVNLPPPSTSPPQATGPAQTGPTPDPAIHAKARQIQASIRTSGSPPVPDAMIPALLNDLASTCTQAYYRPAAQGGTIPADEFASNLKAAIDAQNPGLLPKVLEWVDSDNVAKMMQLATLGAPPPVDWSLEGPRQWLADVWVALG